MHHLLYAKAIIVCSTALVACGCTLGPHQIDRGRLQYNNAIQRTFQEEMLLNLIRLKYREIPEFLTVGGIAAQYSFNSSAGAGLTIPEGALDILSLNGTVSRSEKPTISYTPARGEEFQKGLLAPIDLQSLQLLARTGWSWERILRTTVQYMNDVNNATSAGGPTPDLKPDFEEFRHLTKLLRHLQMRQQVELANLEREEKPKKIPIPRDQLDGDFVINALKEGYTFKDTADGLFLIKDEKYVALVIHPEAKHSIEMQEIAELLGLYVDYDSPEPAVYDFDLATEGRLQPTHRNKIIPLKACECKYEHGEVHRLPPPAGWEEVPAVAPPMGRKDIVVSTRSLLETMFYLSQGISIPQEHLDAGLVTATVDQDGNPFNWVELTGDLLQVCSCKHRPKNAAVSVKYKGYWFYIDDGDLNSQSTFTLLVELFGIEVRAGGGGGFLYTLNVGG
jgi:hypothetical protein